MKKIFYKLLKIYHHPHNLIHRVTDPFHHRLINRGGTYHRWHNWKHHERVHWLVLALIILLIISQIWPTGVKGGQSFIANYNDGSYNAYYAVGSPTASTDTSFPTLTDSGYGGTKSLEYTYDGTSTLKYTTSQNLSSDKGSIELKMQKSAYGNNVNYDIGSFSMSVTGATNRGVKGIFYDSSSNNIYAIDANNNRVVRFKVSGSNITEWQTFGNSGSGVGQFSFINYSNQTAEPTGIHYDSTTGYLYISDTGNNRIVRTKMDGSGWLTLGSLGNGFLQFNKPLGLYYDSASEYIFVADVANSRIIKTKIDGTGWGAVPNTGSKAWSDVSYDPVNGYLYIVANAYTKIMKIKPDGSDMSESAVMSFANHVFVHYDSTTGYLYYPGGGTGVDIVKRSYFDGTSASTIAVTDPSSVFFDAVSQYIYISSQGGFVTKTQWDGTGRTDYGSYYNNLMKFKNYSGGGYPGITGIAYDSTTEFLYIADSSNHRVVKTKFDGTGWQTLGGLSSGSGIGQFNYPNGIAYDASSEFLYITDVGNSRIVKTKMDGTGWTTWGTSGSGTGQFLNPKGIDYCDGNLYIADGGNNRIIKTQFGGTGWIVKTGFSNPSGISYDANSAFIYVADSANNRVVKTQIDGTGWDTFGVVGTGDGQFNYPYDIKIDPITNYLYVLDSANNRMIKTNWGGSDWVQLTGFSFYWSSPSWISSFLRGFAFDSSSGYMYVGNFADSTAKVIRTKIDGTGWITTNDSWSKEKILFSSQTTDDMRIVYDVLSRKIRFYLAYSNKPYFVETDTLNLTDNEWYTIKCTYNRANHNLAIFINGIEVASRTYDTDWGSLSYGTYFYIGARSGSTTDRWDGLIDDIKIDSTPIDTTDPTNPTTIHLYSDSGKTKEFTNGNWGNDADPYITFSGATDDSSGLRGYFLYFGTSNTADPITTSGLLETGGSPHFQDHSGSPNTEQLVQIPVNALTSGQTYYFLVKTQDIDLNITDNASNMFAYKYDGGAPTAPDYINVSPSGCSTKSNFTFEWPAGTDEVSGIAGYEYKKGMSGTTEFTNQTTLTLTPYQEGDNVLYVRSKDNAANTSNWITAIYCSTGAAGIVEGPTVITGPSSITVKWTSSKPSTSYVRVYEGNTYISEQGHTEYSFNHEVQVVGLNPERAYYYQIRWNDQYGNLGETGWYEVMTKTSPSVKNVVIKVINQNSAIVSWETSETCTAALKYGINSLANTVELSGSGTTFSKNLEGLSAGSTYQLRIQAATIDGYVINSDTYLMTTPPYPTIGNVRFDYLPEVRAAVKVSWTTNVPATSAVTWTNKETKETKSTSSAEIVTDHAITVEGLLDNTEYIFSISSRDQYGNTATADNQTYKTPLDTRPPKISNLQIEYRVSGLGKDSKAQIIVSWRTDEPATSQVEYGEGMTPTFTLKSAKDEALTLDHLVILRDLDTAKIYHLRAVSADKSNNITNSETRVVVTPKAQESILDIILKVLKDSFGWLFKLF